LVSATEVATGLAGGVDERARCAMSGGTLDARDASERDAEACAAIYAPYVTDTTITFESDPPLPAEMAERIATAARTHGSCSSEGSDTAVRADQRLATVSDASGMVRGACLIRSPSKLGEPVGCCLIDTPTCFTKSDGNQPRGWPAGTSVGCSADTQRQAAGTGALTSGGAPSGRTKVA